MPLKEKRAFDQSQKGQERMCVLGGKFVSQSLYSFQRGFDSTLSESLRYSIF